MSIVVENEGLFVEIPLTLPSGKFRVKERDCFSAYSIPVPTRQHAMTQKCYVEWQIGYDLLNTPENQSHTTLKDILFENHAGKTKIVYELAEILYHSYQNKLISLEKIQSCLHEVQSFQYTIDSEDIARTHPKEITRNGIQFYEMKVTYPVFVHRFKEYDIYSEVIVKEKQKAVGVQPMLYVCIPITNLLFETNPVGRTLHAKETALWHITAKEAELSCELFKIFGMLSENHRFDVQAMLRAMFHLK